MLEPKAPPARNVPNTGSLAPRVRKRVKKKCQKKTTLNLKEKLSIFQGKRDEKRNVIKACG